MCTRSTPLDPCSAPVFPTKKSPYFHDAASAAWLYQADCVVFMETLSQDHPDGLCDAIFADPPYFLSNGGTTCHAGKRASVDKGHWDRAPTLEKMHAFNRQWLGLCQKLLKPNGTLWVSGTQHVIYSLGYAIQQLEMKLLNTITWEKPNPPPNLACRYFTHSTETLIWAAKNAHSKHCFNYSAMRAENGGKQMKTVWPFTAPRTHEKTFGKHPAQKPVALLERILSASTQAGDLVLDPFCGSGTTGVAAVRLGRRFIGIERSIDFLTLSRQRLLSEGAAPASL